MNKLMDIIKSEMEKRKLKLDKDYVNVFRFNDCIVFYYFDEDKNSVQIDVENLGTHNFFDVNEDIISFGKDYEEGE
jgi:hypothetical protein